MCIYNRFREIESERIWLGSCLSANINLLLIFSSSLAYSRTDPSWFTVVTIHTFFYE
ncbi:MAG: hypothetical protein Sylvanvirus27_7 [Sylvanvirus sp.]|uniref:Uncharacterized protein n=1 Tax=Sylvanvirus sp. TaxID=2487774 RepID=A0A3G5ALD8_9VIRU|nr:MAG: hypothetical protein Sylvanvirus27_7 [Sylvanvirus sp.]